MTIIDFAPEFGAKFVLTGPDGTRAVFNDPTDVDYVGVLTAATGLDSAEVRESGENLVAFDGGVQGPNYYGRRPIVLEGLVYGHSTKEERASKISKIQRASNAMRADATLSWTPSVDGGIPVYVTLRRQQPFRVDGGWNKTFQVPLVAADPRIYSVDIQTLIGYDTNTLHPENLGNTETFPIYTLLGPHANDISVLNAPSPPGVQTNIMTTAELTFSQGMIIDTLKRTVYSGARNVETRRNYYPDPSFESVSTSYVKNASNMTINGIHAAQPSSGPLTGSGKGTKVLQITTGTTASSGTVQLASASGAANIPDGYPTAGGSTVKVGWDMAGHPSTLANQSGFYKIEFFDNIGTSLGVYSGDREPITTTWTRNIANVSAPTNSTRFTVSLGVKDITNANTPAHTYYIDGVTIESKLPSNANYSRMDGSWFYPDHKLVFWTTTEPSESYQAAEDLDPTTLVPAFSVVDFLNTTWAGLGPGANGVRPDHASGSGMLDGAVFRIDWRHAWL